MTMSGNKNHITNAAVLAAAITLAACEKSVPSATAIHVGEDKGVESGATFTERRHFAIYSTYRVMFDDSRDASQTGVTPHEVGPSTVDVIGDAEVAACYIGTPVQD